jgi:hypothetical protein
MISDKLKRAPDLVTKTEYGTVNGHRMPIATVYSSRRFGLEEREEHLAKKDTAPSVEPDQTGDEDRGSRRNRKAAELAGKE